MVGTAFARRFAPLPPDWANRLVDVVDRVALGSNFPKHRLPVRRADQGERVVGCGKRPARLPAPA